MTRSLPIFLRRLSITQLLLVTHFFLVLAVIVGLTYSRFSSEWQHQVENNAQAIHTRTQNLVVDISNKVAFGNYVDLRDVSIPLLLNSIPELKFVEIKQSTPESENPLHVRYLADKNLFWREDISSERLEKIKQRLAFVSQQSSNTTESIVGSVLQHDLTTLYQLSKVSLNHKSKFELSWVLPKDLTDGFWFNPLLETLHIKVPLQGLSQGYVWLVADASKLGTIHNKLASELIREGILALVLSMVMIALVSRWVVVPIKNLSDKMRQEVAAESLEGMPELKRKDEIGELARSYKGLLTKIEKQLSILQAKSDTDSLTGLGTRYKYMRMSVPFVDKYRQQDKYLGLLICDIDNFKAYNDSYGHTAGDNALTMVADAIAGKLHANDLAFRFGGEEFVVLLARGTVEELDIATEVIHQSVEKLDMPHRGNPPYNKITISVGAATCYLRQTDADYPSDELLELLFEQADLSLYHCKSSGRNQIKVESW
ncbi:sensor domain-containing diguanylate cyclase [Vibrio sonorensis]|uniref:sensor domain-containing diguanylate cyclase n=1 Tax=Vibrio sonorensis TaxID=1004316 RepID=UPI0008D93EFA|nr:sensor domain-containing diguanylate cyclase [Vibrio sonorensis]